MEIVLEKREGRGKGCGWARDRHTGQGRRYGEERGHKGCWLGKEGLAGREKEA